MTEEMRYFLTGEIRSADDYASTFRAYGLDEEAVAHGVRVLALSLPTVARGGISGDASKVAVGWLQAQGVKGFSSLT